MNVKGFFEIMQDSLSDSHKKLSTLKILGQFLMPSINSIFKKIILFSEYQIGKATSIDNIFKFKH